MVLGKLPVPGRPTIWTIVEQGPIALAVGAGGGCLDIFALLYLFSSLSPSLCETARYRLKYCLKGPLNPKQPTKQIKKYKSKKLHAKLCRKMLTRDGRTDGRAERRKLYTPRHTSYAWGINIQCFWKRS